MDNEIRLKKVFAETFELPVDEVSDDLAYQQCPKWDSIAHMMLVAAIEAEFNTMLETDDIIDMGSFKRCKEILAKYGVDFSK